MAWSKDAVVSADIFSDMAKALRAIRELTVGGKTMNHLPNPVHIKLPLPPQIVILIVIPPQAPPPPVLKIGTVGGAWRYRAVAMPRPDLVKLPGF